MRVRLILSNLITLLILSGCGNNISITVTKAGLNTPPVIPVVPDTTPPDVTINQAINETVGTCTFLATVEPTNLSTFSYRVTFSEPIDPLTFTGADITNSGSGGVDSLDWTIQNCGDDTNFELIASNLNGNGTIIPGLGAGTVQDPAGNLNTQSTATANSISYSRVWYQEAYIKAVNNGSGDKFGSAISINGDTLAVGVPLEDSNVTTITNGPTASNDNSRNNSGAVYVYKRTGANWTQEAFIKASNADVDDGFGKSVSIYNDTLAVGANGDDSNQITITSGASSDNTKSNSGAVYVYRRTGSNWALEAYIKAVNADSGDIFGSSVSISHDTIVVGAVGERSAENTITNGPTASADNILIGSGGAAYVYRRTGSTWIQEAYIKADNMTANRWFSESISIDGDTLLVSSPGDQSGQTTITNGTGSAYDYFTYSGAGAAFVYRRIGVNWHQEAYIKAAGTQQNYYFAQHLSLSGDTAAITAIGDSNGQTTITNGSGYTMTGLSMFSGAVYIYKRTGVTWAQEAYIKTSIHDSNDFLGDSVAIKGNYVVVGAMEEDSNQTTITNGALASTDNSNPASGAAYVFSRSGVNWKQEAFIKASNNEAGDYFGERVSISGDTIAVSSMFENNSQTTITNGAVASAASGSVDSGAVYVYRNNDGLFDVDTIWTSSNSSSVNLNWNRTGGRATGYIVSYQTGLVAPANCSAGIVVNVGNTNTHQELALSPSTNYSFRVCATDGQETTDGHTRTVTTTP